MQGSRISKRPRSAQDINAAVKTYHYLSERWFTHASPTLFNAGTPRPQLSSCFLICMKVRCCPLLCTANAWLYVLTSTVLQIPQALLLSAVSPGHTCSII